MTDPNAILERARIRARALDAALAQYRIRQEEGGMFRDPVDAVELLDLPYHTASQSLEAMAWLDICGLDPQSFEALSRAVPAARMITEDAA